MKLLGEKRVERERERERIILRCTNDTFQIQAQNKSLFAIDVQLLFYPLKGDFNAFK